MKNNWKRNWTKTELKVFLKRLTHGLGRIPNTADIRYAKDTPGVLAFYKKFGSLADAYRTAGLLKGGK